jgi:hypothetical protein
MQQRRDGDRVEDRVFSEDRGKANDVLMDLHWLAAVARPPRFAPKER